MPFRFLVILLATLSVVPCFANVGDLKSKEEQHVEVSMRMIGHQVLLSLEDSTSRVLPIEKEGNKYRIRFESEFGFQPEILAETIDSVIRQTQIATAYIVGFETCETNQIVHSYEVGIRPEESVLACKSRPQPKACYNLVVTIMDKTESDEVAATSTEPEESSTSWYLWVCLILILLAGVVVWYRKKNKAAVSESNPNVIPIGQYRFNKNNMELWFKEERIELTSKECDLLQLLCDSTNDTVERETILKMVWGDEGDYVGRTLDVFISKLRKKLEADSNVRITNIRGIGYKLIINQ